MWFETLTGFREESPQQVRANLTLDGPTLTSRVNGAVLTCGTLETPTLAELRARVGAAGRKAGRAGGARGRRGCAAPTHRHGERGRPVPGRVAV